MEQMLNLYFEKLSQTVVEASMRAAAGRWPGADLVEFAVAESHLLPEHRKGQIN